MEDHLHVAAQLFELGFGRAADVEVVILDITMPGLSGIETHARLRAGHPELPVLLSSGYPEEALATLESGNPVRDAFIQKPYRNAALFAQIENLLAGGS